MAYATLCKLDALSQGESAAFIAEGCAVLLIWPRDGELKAFQGTCPHQVISLADALFDGKTIVCQAHRWAFDAQTGQGKAPHFMSLTQYPLRIMEGSVQVDVAGERRIP